MPQRPPTFRPLHLPRPVLVENRGTAAQRGYNATWRRFRAAFLRDHPLCVYMDDPRHADECGRGASIVDHIKPLAHGGARLDRNNCRPVCRAAHDRITTNLQLHGRNELS